MFTSYNWYTMTDEVVNSRLEKKDVKLLDQLVELGYFSSRSEAIRNILSSSLKEFFEKHHKSEILEQLEKPPTLSDEQLLEIGKSLFGSSVVKIVTEGRTR